MNRVRGATFHCFEGRTPTTQVLRKLDAEPAEFLVVRRARKGTATFQAFTIDAALLRRLRRFQRRDLTGALALAHVPQALPSVPASTQVLSQGEPMVDIPRGARPREAVVLGLNPDGRGLQAVFAPRHRPDFDLAGHVTRGPIEILGDGNIDGWGARPGTDDRTTATPPLGAAPTAATSRTLFSELRALEPALQGQSLRVVLNLAAQASVRGRPLTLTFPAGHTRLDLHAIVSSRDFEPPAGESWSQRFVVEVRGGATPTSWELRARLRGDAAPGSACTLLVTFLCLGIIVGEHELRLVVGAAATSDPQRPAPLRLPAEAGARFVVVLPPQGPDLYRPQLYADGTLVQELYPQEFKGLALFPSLKPGAGEALDTAAEALRAQVSGDLYEFMRGDASTGEQPLLIVSADTLLPFEALRVGRARGRALFLGAERPVCRWIPDCRMSAYGRRRARAMALLDGITGELPSGPEEAAYLTGRFAGLDRVRTEAEAVQLMERTGIELVHFIGHAAFDSARLTLADGTALVPTFFDRDQALLQGQPVFFLNGCSVGRGAASRPVATGHFPRALVQAGAAAVIAPQVDVVSSVAQVAARAFYEAGPVTLAQAVQAVRRRAYDAPDDLERGTLLSYAAYAPANLSLELPDGAGAGDTPPTLR